jgi:hypothetical protein
VGLRNEELLALLPACNQATLQVHLTADSEIYLFTYLQLNHARSSDSQLPLLWLIFRPRCQVLDVSGNQCDLSAALPFLPHSLTELSADDGGRLDARSAAGLGRLTRLRLLR